MKKLLISTLFMLVLLVNFTGCTDPVSPIIEDPKPIVEKREQIQVFVGWDLRTVQDSVNEFLSFLAPEDIIEIIHNVRNIYYQGDLHPQHYIIVRFLII